MICRICEGTGNVFVIRPSLMFKTDKHPTWLACPGCFGLGTWRVESPVHVQMNNRVGKNIAKLNRKLDFEEKRAR